jgi:hypothetical protein
VYFLLRSRRRPNPIWNLKHGIISQGTDHEAYSRPPQKKAFSWAFFFVKAALVRQKFASAWVTLGMLPGHLASSSS